jgi:hypothetical protein
MRPCVQVTATVTCEAAGPWGLVSTIEGIMAQQAEASVKSFLNFCAARCAASPEVQLLPDYASDTDTLDVFQDAAESLTTMTSSHVSGVLTTFERRIVVKGFVRAEAYQSIWRVCKQWCSAFS